VTVNVTFAPSIRFQRPARSDGRARLLDRERQRTGTMSVATWVWAGRSPETNVVPPVTRPLAFTVTFGYVPATTPVAANEATPATTADRIDLDDALAGGRGVRVGERAERLPRR